MLITACFGLGCNVLNLLALNFFCNSEDDDDFEDEEISDVDVEGEYQKRDSGLSKGSGQKSNKSLAE
jgi:hypothetical protein